MRITIPLIALIAMMAGITSCTDYDTNPPRITAENPVLMDVGTVDVNAIPNYDQPNLLRVTPESLVQEWFTRKVQAVGSNARRFTVDVVKSQTTRNPTSTSPKFEAYTTELALEMKLYEPDANLATMQSSVTLKLTREVKHNASAPEREAFFAGLTRELVRKMDTEIPAQLEKYFEPYLIGQ
jgi:hypothetical protein